MVKTDKKYCYASNFRHYHPVMPGVFGGVFFFFVNEDI